MSSDPPYDDSPPTEPPPDYVDPAEPEASNVGNVVQLAGKKRSTKAKPKPRPKATKNQLSDEKPTYATCCRLLREDYAMRLSYDLMREAPCLDRLPLRDAHVGIIREMLERDHGIAFGAENVAQAVKQVAEEHSFHPVKDYLRSLEWDRVARIRDVGPKALGTSPDDDLAQAMLRRFFLAAVARGLKPGIKADCALVLVGPQGYKKSSFFAALGGEWFCDTHVDVSDKDGMLQLAAAWIYEWPEIDRVTTRRHASDVKAFLSKRDDTFRPPFARNVIRHDRGCVVVGTTNEARYLVDDTGSRRFWTVTIGQRVDIDLVREWRDQLFAEAVAAFDGGEEHFLSEDEERAREERARDDHAVDNEDPWQAPIENWLRQSWHDRGPRTPETHAMDVLSLAKVFDGLHLPVTMQDSGARVRVCKILRDLGYINPRIYTPIGRIRCWVKASERELKPETTA